MLSMLTQACGGFEPAVMDRTADLSAPISVMEADLPGCEALTSTMILDQDLAILQHPASSELVVLVAEDDKPLCVDTLAGVKAKLEAMKSALTMFQGVLPESESDDGEGEGGGDEGGDDKGEKKTPKPLKSSVTIQTNTLVSDDPIPIFLTSSTK